MNDLEHFVCKKFWNFLMRALRKFLLRTKVILNALDKQYLRIAVVCLSKKILINLWHL